MKFHFFRVNYMNLKTEIVIVERISMSICMFVNVCRWVCICVCAHMHLCMNIYVCVCVSLAIHPSSNSTLHSIYSIFFSFSKFVTPNSHYPQYMDLFANPRVLRKQFQNCKAMSLWNRISLIGVFCISNSFNWVFLIWESYEGTY